jgi:hypothetical protein
MNLESAPIKARGPNVYSVKVFWFSPDGVTMCSVLPRTFYYILGFSLFASAAIIVLYPLPGAFVWWATMIIAYLVVRTRRERIRLFHAAVGGTSNAITIPWASIAEIGLSNRRVRLITTKTKYEAYLPKNSLSEFENLVENTVGRAVGLKGRSTG